MQINKQFSSTLGSSLAYVDVGEGLPIVFLHGNPTSSFLWRNVIPQVAGLGRVVAPDLIGMGDSSKLVGVGDERYRFVEHRRHLDAFLDSVGVYDRVVLVVHHWGSALGFDWAARNPDPVAGIAYMEAIVHPFTTASMGEAAEFFEVLRSPAGEQLVLDENAFIETMLPAETLKPLDDAAMAEYRRPFTTAGEDRRPTLTWAREVPIDGQPADVEAIVAAYAAFMSTSPIPKLFVNGDPGMALTGELRDFARSWPNQIEVTVPGLHLLQEDSPHEIGTALAEWIGGLER
jgi:haloalkane dehalogenase